jgi:hypothetical protein
MNVIIEISFLFLTTLTVLQALVLHDVLREASRLPLFRSHQIARPAVPRFSMPLLDAASQLTDRDLRTRITGLLFIAPIAKATLAPHLVTSIIHALWHKFEGALYLVCAGSVESCRKLRDEQRLLHAYGGDVQVVLDVDGQLANAFGVPSNKPSAAIVDANGLVQGTGSLVEESLTRDEQNPRATTLT